MTRFRCCIAETQRQLDAALQVRWKVFAEEMGLLQVPFFRVPREVNGFDTLATTVHFVAYAGQEPVATVRLLLPNGEVARENGHRIGIALEEKLDLAEFDRSGVCLAETTRFCVLRGFRCSGVVAQLYAEMHRESRRRGVTHWVASANTETDVTEDSRIAYQVARGAGLVDPRWRVRPRGDAHPAGEPRFPLYTPEERRRAREGDVSGLRLPRTLSLFSLRMGARFIGEPIYDPQFRMYSMPLVVELAQGGIDHGDHHEERHRAIARA